jgi:hypothetical protein
MAAYKLSESVRMVPYFANLTGGLAGPNDEQLMLGENGQPRVYNLPVGGRKTLVYTEKGDLDGFSEKDLEEYDLVVYSPFPRNYEGLEDIKFNSISGEYSAVEKLGNGSEEKKQKAAPRGRASQQAPADKNEEK